ncbi:hypothetical protein BDV11DRAFT_200756 [Aspergillus similis]
MLLNIELIQRSRNSASIQTSSFRSTQGLLWNSAPASATSCPGVSRHSKAIRSLSQE